MRPKPSYCRVAQHLKLVAPPHNKTPVPPKLRFFAAECHPQKPNPTGVHASNDFVLLRTRHRKKASL
nr:hypothetical protein Iba_chr07eCG2770 [Ipomoea batatas]